MNFNNFYHKKDLFWLLGFFLAAIFLYTFNLGEVALRDWDEGIVASIAREIWRANPESYTWLYPKNIDGSPYWNKPPLIHDLIALSYSFFGVGEWSTRLIPAIISALSVPLLYAIAREIFPRRQESVFTALVYLTLIPVARHGRLAMLDGVITCFFGAVIWCLLKALKADFKGNLRLVKYYLFGVGSGLGLICLTKGIALGLLLGLLLLVFIYLDLVQAKNRFSYIFQLLIRQQNKRILINYCLPLILGLVPAISWYSLQLLHYGTTFIAINLGTQTFSRVTTAVENNSSPVWFYILEIAKYTMPWLLFLPGGIRLAFSNYRETWAKLSLVWFMFYLIAISLMATKLPWYIMPIYPAFSLLVGINLATIYDIFNVNLISKVLLLILTIGFYFGSIYYSWFKFDRDLQLVSITLAIFFTIALILITIQSNYFIFTISAGLYLALLLLFNSSHWNWELGETYAVKPVANLIKKVTPPRNIIYTSYPYYRPSLDFYSDRQVIPLPLEQLQNRIQLSQETVYLLLSNNDSYDWSLKKYQILASTQEWKIIKSLNIETTK